jgi:hypothetical protein
MSLNLKLQKFSPVKNGQKRKISLDYLIPVQNVLKTVSTIQRSHKTGPNDSINYKRIFIRQHTLLKKGDVIFQGPLILYHSVSNIITRQGGFG